ncbi:MAG: PAS domain-containing protein [Prevotella sp.]|nr:PAS domain-containing protein [Prevotella sp.]
MNTSRHTHTHISYATFAPSLIALVTLMLAALAPAGKATAQLARRFSNTNPLIVVADSANRPYEYLDETGTPSGLHVEMIGAILDQMLIPHRFILTTEYEARQALLHQEADLMLEKIPTGQTRPYPVSSSVLSYMQTDEERLAGTDKNLLDIMDNQLFRMAQSGEMEALQTKWFSPDKQTDDASPLAVIFTIAMLLLAVVLLAILRVRLKRLRQTLARMSDLNRMMSQALDMGDFNVIQYDIKTQTVTTLHGSMLPPGTTLPMTEFLQRLTLRDDPDEGIRMMDYLINGGEGTRQLRSRWNAGTKDEPQWHDMVGHAVAEKDEDGHVAYIISSITDITSLQQEQQTNTSLANKYAQTFEKSLIGLMLLSPDGQMIECNREMRRLLKLDHPDAHRHRTTSFFDFGIFKETYPRGSRHKLHCSSHLRLDDIELDLYVEMRIAPVINEHGDIIYYSLAMRDLTEERNLYMALRRQELRLKQLSDQISANDNKLQYLLVNANMYIWHSNMKEQKMYYSRTLLFDEDIQTFTDYIKSIAEEQREHMNQFVTHLDQHQHNVNSQRHISLTMHGQRDQWFNVVGLPYYDADGKFNGHIGLMRNITSIVNARERLRQETQRAEDSGRLKSVFLANMTHEIRTPLNAIVGFSDILSTLTQPEDQKEFINIINQNCDMLLRLIDDILEASSMDSGEQHIDPAQVDFAKSFHSIATELSLRNSSPAIQFIEDNPCQTLIATQDMGRIKQLLTNFVTNSVKYTKQGHIKIGYRQQDGGLYIYCEDTGLGIAKDKQAHVFERFYKVNDFIQGTGLGLAICSSIAKQCGGRIGLESEGENMGTTFWVWLPLNVETAKH